MEAKKLNDKMNAQLTQISKLKATNSELQEKMDAVNLDLRQQNRDLDQAEREKRKQAMDGGSKDAKLNRALEELDRVRMQLREAKMSDQGKSEGARRDMEKLVEDNRKLER